MWKGSCDGSTYAGMDQKLFVRVLALAPEKIRATGRLSQFERVLALVSETERCWMWEWVL